VSVQVTVRCPGCTSALPVNASDGPAAIRCGRCGREVPLAFTEAIRADERVDRCPVCEGAAFYVRRDFDPKVGLAFVITGAVTSAIFYWFDLDLIAYGVLAAAVLIDLIIYARLKDITVCYRCHAEFRGMYQRSAGAFDLHTADELEPEWERRIGRR